MDDQLQAEIKRLKSEYLTLWDEFCVMRDRNVGLQKSVDELQRWKNAVPLDAIRIAQDGRRRRIETYAALNAIDAWLATIAPKPLPAQSEVQP